MITPRNVASVPSSQVHQVGEPTPCTNFRTDQIFECDSPSSTSFGSQASKLQQTSERSSSSHGSSLRVPVLGVFFVLFGLSPFKSPRVGGKSFELKGKLTSIQHTYVNTTHSKTRHVCLTGGNKQKNCVKPPERVCLTEKSTNNKEAKWVLNGCVASSCLSLEKVNIFPAVVDSF